METLEERNYGIDLLRLVLMFLICLHHTLGQGGVLNNMLIENRTLYNCIYIITMIGVDGFAIISGYVASGAKQRYWKIVEMWFQIFFYSFGIPFVINILRLFIQNETFSMIEIVKGMFPIVNHTYWYFDAYIVLFFFMPFINKALNDLDVKKSKMSLYVLFLLMVFMWLNNNAQDHNFISSGRSAFWLILMYIVGSLIKKSDFLRQANSFILFLFFVALSVISYVYVSLKNLSLENIDPTVWLASITIVIIFSRIKANKKIVSILSPLSFGVYLFHTNYYFRYYYLSERFLYSDNLNTIYGFLCVIGTATFIFTFGLIVDYIRTVIFRKMEIRTLSKRIASCIERTINKIT